MKNGGFLFFSFLTKIKNRKPLKTKAFGIACVCGVQKDAFMFFVDRVELSEFLMKSFALLTMKSKPTVLMKFSATQKMKLNPPIAAAISYAESVFHIAKQYFTHPQGWI